MMKNKNAVETGYLCSSCKFYAPHSRRNCTRFKEYMGKGDLIVSYCDGYKKNASPPPDKVRKKK